MRTLALLPLLTVGLVSADTLTLKNGRVLNGTFLGGTAREIRLDMGDHVETVAVDRISGLQFDNSAPVAQAEPPRDREPRREASNPNFDRFNGPQGGSQQPQQPQQP